ncbi:helix-turn-helix domain-containing protein [Bacillus sp. SD075]|uniref:helix-turn-helix domain-containing protein n=1 Tax=Bacillus sp. SD075 TaxID=2781732 RepID=UPI001A97CDEA|nr:helix-turn-helix domain-containing protein [Bacillus sp. SD075]MBO0999318.1 helix-turn-helix domain-containing protein [Bacillus sp. SD075]
MEELVQKVLEVSCEGTKAEAASIYLYDESENCFHLQSPSMGTPKLEETIMVKGENELHAYFPYFEKSGGLQLSVPLVVNLKTVGMIHLANKAMGAFTLRYRLERIHDILDMDLEDAETRLNLMIAYKLHDLYQSSQLYSTAHSLYMAMIKDLDRVIFYADFVCNLGQHKQAWENGFYLPEQ